MASVDGAIGFLEVGEGMKMESRTTTVNDVDMVDVVNQSYQAPSHQSGMERVLVTGASGYIASHVVLQLLQSGHKVKGTVRSLHNESKVKHLKNLCIDSTYPLELVEADLTNEQSWISAVKDCDAVLHLASPFPTENPKDESVLIIPAVEGTQNVLKACALSSTVKRVVLTSSVASICDFSKDFEGDANESNWPDVDSLDPYSKSKMLAEKEAWNFMDKMETRGEKTFDLVVINPGFVLGPVLSGSSCTSMEVIKRLMCRDPPLIPKMNFSVVDVRDVASAHIAAMKLPEANGRYITTAGNMSMKEMSAALREEFKEQGYHPPGTGVPHFLFKLVALFDTGAKRIAPFRGKKIVFNNSKL
ncbi:uncharacterized protein [Asterias amurensis]|uniref:uncharacterized protein isoform X3 n=1 Tax=Asterias amurensis TaxID=7602 RepID=UPI003AB6F760